MSRSSLEVMAMSCCTIWLSGAIHAALASNVLAGATSVVFSV